MKWTWAFNTYGYQLVNSKSQVPIEFILHSTLFKAVLYQLQVWFLVIAMDTVVHVYVEGKDGVVSSPQFRIIIEGVNTSETNIVSSKWSNSSSWLHLLPALSILGGSHFILSFLKIISLSFGWPSHVPRYQIFNYGHGYPHSSSLFSYYPSTISYPAFP